MTPRTRDNGVTSALLTEWSRLLIGSLRALGVKDAVISPGSRSTPFVWAATQEPGLRCHSIVDERAAAFFALGQARYTGKPTLLICTSGSAAANYFPAIVEAKVSATPLLVLTADRPLDLQQCRSPQTIDQIKLYGDYAAFFELGEPVGLPTALRGLKRTLTQAYALTSTPRPGPVHLNARARKPLEPAVPAEPTKPLEPAALEPTEPAEPSRASEQQSRAVAEEVRALLGARPTVWRSERNSVSEETLRDLVDGLLSARQPLILIGALPRAEAVDGAALSTVLDRSGATLFAEASSQARFGEAVPQALDALPWLLACPNFRRVLRADWVLELGAPLLTSSWAPYLGELSAPIRHIVNRTDFSDPEGGATSVISAAPADVIRALARTLEPACDQPAKRAPVDACNRLAWAIVQAVLEEADKAGLSEGTVARLVVEEAPPGSVLAVGNSLPIRHLDAYCPANSRNLAVMTQRGASGIDGLIAGAAGAAHAAGVPTTLFLGDISFLHDVGGLATARGVSAPFVVVVLNNQGGRIFEQLPLRTRDLPPGVAAFWTTPHEFDLKHAAALYGARFERALSPDELQRALRAAYKYVGPTVIDVRVPPSNAVQEQQLVRLRLDAALARFGGLEA